MLGHCNIDLHVGYLLKVVAGRHLASTQSPALLGQLPGRCGQSAVSGAGAAPLLAGPAPDELEVDQALSTLDPLSQRPSPF